jgi:hypothetical protein
VKTNIKYNVLTSEVIFPYQFKCHTTKSTSIHTIDDSPLFFLLSDKLGDNIDAVVLFPFEEIVILLISAVLDYSSEFLFSIWPF